MTAAHAFDLVEVEYKGKLIPKPSKAAMFVPAMTAKDDINMVAIQLLVTQLFHSQYE